MPEESITHAYGHPAFRSRPRPGASQGSLCIVTELLSRGSLEDVIREGGLRTASYALILNLALQASTLALYSAVFVRVGRIAPISTN